MVPSEDQVPSKYQVPSDLQVPSDVQVPSISKIVKWKPSNTVGAEHQYFQWCRAAALFEKSWIRQIWADMVVTLNSMNELEDKDDELVAQNSM